MNQTIQCTDMESFLAAIAGLTREGIAFEARTYDFRITITGF